MKIGLICAFGEEGKHILHQMKIEDVVERLKTHFIKGKFLDWEIVLVIGGMGKVSSALCTQVLIDQFGVDIIIFSGIAGCVNPALNIGDTVIATDVMYHDVDRAGEGIDLNTIYSIFRNTFKTEPALLEKVQTGLAGKSLTCSPKLKDFRGGSEVKITYGRILTGDQVITSKAKVQELHQTYSADCVEMEGAAVAQTCVLNSRPFIIIRTISDLADEDAMKIISSTITEVVSLNYQVLMEVLKILG